jgi:hypothetical protein
LGLVEAAATLFHRPLVLRVTVRAEHGLDFLFVPASGCFINCLAMKKFLIEFFIDLHKSAKT